jgi:hypothetical protein
MCPVYFGFLRISRTADPDHRPTARLGSVGVGGGYRARSLRCWLAAGMR